MSIFETGLERNRANYAALTPSDFLERAGATFPEKVAIIHGDLRRTYGDFLSRSRRLADALRKRGIGQGDAVSVLAPNTPAMLESHYGIPMAGAVLNAINTRLDAATISFILGHAESKLVLVDKEFAPVMEEALAQIDNRAFKGCPKPMRPQRRARCLGTGGSMRSRPRSSSKAA